MKKDILKSGLVAKKPVIQEREAQKVVEKVHGTQVSGSVSSVIEEEEQRTSFSMPKSLFKAMNIKLIEEGVPTMKEYLVNLIKADLNKYKGH